MYILMLDKWMTRSEYQASWDSQLDFSLDSQEEKHHNNMSSYFACHVKATKPSWKIYEHIGLFLHKMDYGLSLVPI